MKRYRYLRYDYEYTVRYLAILYVSFRFSLDRSRWLNNKEPEESSRSRSPLKRITEVPLESTPNRIGLPPVRTAEMLMPPPPGRPLLQPRAQSPPLAPPPAGSSEDDEPEASRQERVAAEKRKSRSKTRHVNKNAAASNKQGAVGNTTISMQVKGCYLQSLSRIRTILIGFGFLS